MASSPLAASATVSMSGWASMMDWRPARTTGWSSTTSTLSRRPALVVGTRPSSVGPFAAFILLAPVGGERHLHHHLLARSRLAVQREVPAHPGRALAVAHQPHVSGRR